MIRNDPDGRVDRERADRKEHDDGTMFFVVPTVAFNWSAWVPWPRLELDIRNQAAVSLPDSPGVYEVKYAGNEQRLAIGATDNLRLGLQERLVRGYLPYPTERQMRENEETAQVEIRWAEVEQPAATIEGLYVRHLACFGYLPKYDLFV